MKFITTLLLYLFFTGCAQKKEQSNFHWEPLYGRKASKEEIYRIYVPNYWKKKNPITSAYLTDTTCPICEFFIEEEKVRIAFHTFPHSAHEKQISPWTQVERWKRQMNELDEDKVTIEKVSHNGFSGLYFEAEKSNAAEKVIAWSLIVDPYFFSQLNDPHYLADLTIKISGDKELIDHYKSEIIASIESLEITKEIIFQR